MTFLVWADLGQFWGGGLPMVAVTAFKGGHAGRRVDRSPQSTAAPLRASAPDASREGALQTRQPTRPDNIESSWVDAVFNDTDNTKPKAARTQAIERCSSAAELD